MSMCLRVLSSRSDLMKDVFGDLSRMALVNMLAANDSKDGVEWKNEVSKHLLNFPGFNYSNRTYTLPNASTTKYSNRTTNRLVQ